MSIRAADGGRRRSSGRGPSTMTAADSQTVMGTTLFASSSPSASSPSAQAGWLSVSPRRDVPARVTDAITPSSSTISGVEDWRLLAATARPRTSDQIFRGGQARGRPGDERVPGIDDVHPVVDLRHDGVTVRMITFTKTTAGMRRAHVELAPGSRARRDSLDSLRTSVRGPDRVGHPWSDLTRRGDAVLAGRPSGTSLGSTAPRGPRPIRATEGRRSGSKRWKSRPGRRRRDPLRCLVPYEQARARIDAALAAGGRMVRDANAPSWWTLADAAGNEVDIATTVGRD